MTVGSKLKKNFGWPKWTSLFCCFLQILYQCGATKKYSMYSYSSTGWYRKLISNSHFFDFKWIAWILIRNICSVSSVLMQRFGSVFMYLQRILQRFSVSALSVFAFPVVICLDSFNGRKDSNLSAFQRIYQRFSVSGSVLAYLAAF